MVSYTRCRVKRHHLRKEKSSMRNLTRIAAVGVAALAVFLADGSVLPAQTGGAAATASQPSSGSASDAATKQIMDAIQGSGKKIDLSFMPPAGQQYKVRQGDYVNINFTLATQFNESVPVRPDGYIALIGAPELYVIGKTMPEITAEVSKAYAGILSEAPMLSVSVRNFQLPYFMVGGQVARPGKYALHGDTTLAQSIAIAGGPQGATAKDSEALLLRRTSADYVQVRKVDLKYIDKGELYNDVHLQSGDMVFIPKNRLSKVQPFISYFLVYSVLNINVIGGNVGLVGH
jgi:protein involved in polysaccharide export with SLBB domain